MGTVSVGVRHGHPPFKAGTYLGCFFTRAYSHFIPRALLLQGKIQWEKCWRKDGVLFD